MVYWGGRMAPSWFDLALTSHYQEGACDCPPHPIERGPTPETTESLSVLHLLESSRDGRRHCAEPLSQNVEDSSHTLLQLGLGDDLLNEGGFDHGFPSSKNLQQLWFVEVQAGEHLGHRQQIGRLLAALPFQPVA